MKKHPVWAKITAFIAGFLFLIVLFLTCFQLTIFNRSFVSKEMKKYGVAERIGMTDAALDELYDEMLKYLEGKRGDLDIKVVRYGQETDAFYEKELLHMVDVEALFHGGFLLRNALAGVTAILIMVLFVKKQQKPLYGGFMAASGFFVVAVGILAYLLTRDFDRTFIRFHEIFFTNDLWQLDYATDLLMNIVPETFSRDVAIRTVVVFVAVWIPLLIASAVLCAKKKK